MKSGDIVGKNRKKDYNDYLTLMNDAFKNVSRMLKNDSYMFLYFHDSSLTVWNDLIKIFDKNDLIFKTSIHISKSQKTLKKILDPKKIRIVYNSEWLAKMSFEDVIKLTGKYTVARILERDDFKNRFNNNIPIGIHEFLYPLMQGYDSVALHADIEVGGTDQTFNLLVGRELQRDYDQEPQDVMCFPLLVGLDGKEKMSKSLENYIGVDESPEKMYEKAMRIPDDVLLDYFKLTTDLDMKDVENMMSEDILLAHRKYAEEIIKMYHGEEFINQAEERYNTVAKGCIPENIEIFEIKENMLENGLLLTELLNLSNIVSSKSEGRRMIEQNGISVNGTKEKDIKTIGKQLKEVYQEVLQK